MTTIPLRDRLIGGVIGTLVGDALGVPVEFTARSSRDADPVTGMRGFGTHNQLAGTWSDDSSMTLVTTDVLSRLGWDLHALMSGFLGWYNEARWTPHGVVFDIGNATRSALVVYRIEGDLDHCGQRDEQDNGNGSLMRCLPVSGWLLGTDSETRIRMAKQASAVTHAHVRSQLCCAWHAVWCDAVVGGSDMRAAAAVASQRLRREVPADETRHLGRILDGSCLDLPRCDVISDGYVVSTLEASLWCLARHGDFAGAVLAAVNLGGDADTTGAVTGGMAGLRGGIGAIPPAWINALARRDDVMRVAERFADACLARWNQADTADS